MLTQYIVEVGVIVGAANLANGVIIVVVVRVYIACKANLVKIALALRQFCLPFGRRQRRQQQRRQDGDDGDDHQQFNEGETT